MNKKFVTGASITLIVILGASIGMGALIGSKTKKDLDYFSFHLKDKEYKYSLEDTYTDNESAAKQVENKFLIASLVGDVAGETFFKDSTSILDENEDWNIPYIISEDVTKDNVLQLFVGTKLFKETLTSSVFEYVVKQYSETKDVSLLKVIAEFKGQTDMLSMNFLQLLNKGDDGKKIITDLIKCLGGYKDKDDKWVSGEDNYINDVLKDIFTYAYLWQDSNSSAYDYYFTKEIAYSKPSMVSSVEFDATQARFSDVKDDYNMLADLTTGDPGTLGISSTDWNSLWTKEGWKTILVDPSTIDTKIGDDGFVSFDGVKFGESAGSTVSNDWTDIDQTWNYEDEEMGESVTSNGSFTHDDILKKGNLYTANPNKAPGAGAIISEDSSSHGKRINGNAQVFAYSQMYPYVFSEKIDEDNFGPTSYSLFATKGDDGYTKASSEDEDITYIFNEWFGDGIASKVGEIYLSEELSTFNSSLSTRAIQFWHNKGYYIELSGKYSDDFSSFISEDLLK